MTPGVAHARAEDYLRSLPDASVGLVLTDPPYFRVKGLAWDTFAGSGVFLSAAAQLDRVAIGCDADEWWSARANRAVTNATEPAVSGGQIPLVGIR